MTCLNLFSVSLRKLIEMANFLLIYLRDYQQSQVKFSHVLSIRYAPQYSVSLHLTFLNYSNFLDKTLILFVYYYFYSHFIFLCKTI